VEFVPLPVCQLFQTNMTLIRNRKLIFLCFMIICVAVVSLPQFGQAKSTAGLTILKRGARLDIHAQKVALLDVLEALCDQAGVILITEGTRNDIISLNLKSVTVEEGFKRILSNRNYTLLFRKDKSGRFVPLELRIFGDQAGEIQIRKPRTTLSDVDSESPERRFKKDLFLRAFQDTNKLMGQLKAEPLDGKDHPENSGIRLTRLSEASVFNEIGLRPGDVIQDVNGRQIRTALDFINGIKASLAKDIPAITIRIERLRSNGLMDPIYLELY
jgi:hypothetical protein